MVIYPHATGTAPRSIETVTHPSEQTSMACTFNFSSNWQRKEPENNGKTLKNITRKQRKPLKTIENHWKSFKLPENHWNTFWTSSLKQCVAKYRMEVTKSSTWHHITHLHPGYSHPNEGILFNHWEWLLNNMIMGISVEYSTKRDLTTINTWLYPW